ncbi:hypothetical protein GCM10011533_13680 [Streptosporangium jomthongense]|nr:hypothetical protein GCM10011533_13680 [Streptosporangium jomthongense]
MWEACPKMLVAREGGEQAYRDVFTAVFGQASHTAASIAEVRSQTNLETKHSLKPVTYSQVKGFQEEGSFARRKVPQFLH